MTTVTDKLVLNMLDTMAKNCNNILFDVVIEQLQANKVVNAIKFYRRVTGMQLKPAKQFIDTLRIVIHPQYKHVFVVTEQELEHAQRIVDAWRLRNDIVIDASMSAQICAHLSETA